MSNAIRPNRARFAVHSLLIVSAVLAGTYAPHDAHALLIKWTLSGATFTDGGSASGSFFYEADTSTMTGFDVTTTAGLALAGNHYLDLNGTFPPYPSNGFAVVIPDTPPLPPNAPFLALQFQTALSNAGGAINLLAGGEGFCSDSICATASYRRVFNAGRIVGVQVPEPGMLSLLVIAAGALLLARRKNLSGGQAAS
jgi:hypothetical protein